MKRFPLYPLSYRPIFVCAPPPANPARGACGTAGVSDTSTIVLDGQQLNWLLDGYDLAAMRPHRSLCYRTVL